MGSCEIFGWTLMAWHCTQSWFNLWLFSDRFAGAAHIMTMLAFWCTLWGGGHLNTCWLIVRLWSPLIGGEGWQSQFVFESSCKLQLSRLRKQSIQMQSKKADHKKRITQYWSWRTLQINYLCNAVSHKTSLHRSELGHATSSERGKSGKNNRQKVKARKAFRKIVMFQQNT